MSPLMYGREDNAGGPAFPTEDQSRNYHGMSLRDWFAGKFMVRAQSLCETNDGWDCDTAAQCAYEMADAMLKARAAQ